MPKYKVVAHRRVHKFLSNLSDENFKFAVTCGIAKLDGYPLVLREMDVEKIRGMDKTFRIRFGTCRIIFFVDDAERTIFVTHAEARKKAYTKR